MKSVYEKVNGVVRTVEGVAKTTHEVIDPVRKSAFRRFPTLFTILVTFGVVATFLGIEKIITLTSGLNERPWLIFGIGISILILTGNLHKKLD